VKLVDEENLFFLAQTTRFPFSPPMPHLPTNPPSLSKSQTLLLGADILAVVAILIVHFFTPASENTVIAAYAAIVVAGLGVVTLLYLTERQHTSSNAIGAVTALRHDIADNQRTLQGDVRALAESTQKRFAALEKQLHASSADPSPALAELAARIEQLAASRDDGTDAEDTPLLAALEAFQSQLDQFAESIRALEITVRQTADASPAWRDGTDDEPPATAPTTPFADGTDASPDSPSEDELWPAASDMANDEADNPADPATTTPHSLHPKTSPAPTDASQTTLDLGLPPPPARKTRPAENNLLLDLDLHAE
jgi:hypothetical protein